VNTVHVITLNDQLHETEGHFIAVTDSLQSALEWMRAQFQGEPYKQVWDTGHDYTSCWMPDLGWEYVINERPVYDFNTASMHPLLDYENRLERGTYTRHLVNLVKSNQLKRKRLVTAPGGRNNRSNQGEQP